MTYNEWFHRMEDEANARREQIEGRAEQAIGGFTGDREQRAQGLTDEVKGKLLDFKSRLQDAFDGHDSDPGPGGRH